MQSKESNFSFHQFTGEQRTCPSEIKRINHPRWRVISLPSDSTQLPVQISTQKVTNLTQIYNNNEGSTNEFIQKINSHRDNSQLKYQDLQSDKSHSNSQGVSSYSTQQSHIQIGSSIQNIQSQGISHWNSQIKNTTNKNSTIIKDHNDCNDEVVVLNNMDQSEISNYKYHEGSNDYNYRVVHSERERISLSNKTISEFKPKQDKQDDNLIPIQEQQYSSKTYNSILENLSRKIENIAKIAKEGEKHDIEIKNQITSADHDPLSSLRHELNFQNNFQNSDFNEYGDTDNNSEQVYPLTNRSNPLTNRSNPLTSRSNPITNRLISSKCLLNQSRNNMTNMIKPIDLKAVSRRLEDLLKNEGEDSDYAFYNEEVYKQYPQIYESTKFVIYSKNDFEIFMKKLVLQEETIKSHLLIQKELTQKNIQLTENNEYLLTLYTKQQSNLNGDGFLKQQTNLNGEYLLKQQDNLNGDDFLKQKANLNGEHLLKQQDTFNRDNFLKQQANLNGEHLVKQQDNFIGQHFLQQQIKLNGEHSLKQQINLNEDIQISQQMNLNEKHSLNQKSNLNEEHSLYLQNNLNREHLINQQSNLNGKHLLKQQTNLNGEHSLKQQLSLNGENEFIQQSKLNGQQCLPDITPIKKQLNQQFNEIKSSLNRLIEQNPFKFTLNSNNDFLKNKIQIGSNLKCPLQMEDKENQSQLVNSNVFQKPINSCHQLNVTSYSSSNGISKRKQSSLGKTAGESELFYKDISNTFNTENNYFSIDSQDNKKDQPLLKVICGTTINSVISSGNILNQNQSQSQLITNTSEANVKNKPPIQPKHKDTVLIKDFLDGQTDVKAQVVEHVFLPHKNTLERVSSTKLLKSKIISNSQDSIQNVQCKNNLLLTQLENISKQKGEDKITEKSADKTIITNKNQNIQITPFLHLAATNSNHIIKNSPSFIKNKNSSEHSKNIDPSTIRASVLAGKISNSLSAFNPERCEQQENKLKCNQGDSLVQNEGKQHSNKIYEQSNLTKCCQNTSESVSVGGLQQSQLIGQFYLPEQSRPTFSVHRMPPKGLVSFSPTSYSSFDTKDKDIKVGDSVISMASEHSGAPLRREQTAMMLQKIVRNPSRISHASQIQNSIETQKNDENIPLKIKKKGVSCTQREFEDITQKQSNTISNQTSINTVANKSAIQQSTKKIARPESLPHQNYFEKKILREQVIRTHKNDDQAQIIHTERINRDLLYGYLGSHSQQRFRHITNE